MADAYVYKNAQKTAAIAVETQAELDAVAEVLASVVRSVAAPHGSLPSRVSITSGDVDRFVNITHEDIAAIEFGGVRKDGRVVKGLHVLGRSAGMMGG